MNAQAKLINDALGVKIYNESFTFDLILNLYTQKEIKEMCIDDLIDSSGFKTKRLLNFETELLDLNLQD